MNGAARRPGRLIGDLMVVRAVVVWPLLLALAVANGFFRESSLVPQMGAGGGRVVGTLLLSAPISAQRG